MSVCGINFKLTCCCRFEPRDSELLEKGFHQEGEHKHEIRQGSENGQDLETAWSDYWQTQGPSLVWQSWIEKYKDYINPEYLKTVDGGATSEGASSRVHAQEGEPASDSNWTTIWDEHQTEQRDYYSTWFSQWWSQSEGAVESVLSLEELSLDSKLEMDEAAQSSDAAAVERVKEQRDKTNLEKTGDYLTELGFSTTINQPSSIITECCRHSKSTKKSKRQKKKRVNLGKVPAQAGALFKVCLTLNVFVDRFPQSLSPVGFFFFARSEISCLKSILMRLLLLLLLLQIQLYRMWTQRMTQMRPRK